jgi:hypothetical protein
MCSKVHYEKIKNYLRIGVEEGGTILVGEGVQK